MKTQPIQPDATRVTTKHAINYKGVCITIIGNHERKYDPRSKIDFRFWVVSEQKGISFGSKSTLTFKEKLDYLVKSITEAKAYKQTADCFKSLHNSLTLSEKIAHTNFAYARFQTSSLGNYYNLYWQSQLSPTGVELVGGCSEIEWETISKATGKSCSYYSSTENKITAR